MSKYFGKICLRHPDAGGERYIGNGNCVPCAKELSASVHAKRTMTIPQELTMLRGDLRQAREERDQLKAEVEALRKDLESHKRMLLGAACSLGAIGKALGADMDDDPSELEGIAVDLRKDANRYRWFRQQHWDSSVICAVVDPKLTTRLGAYCPSGRLLDNAIDAGLAMSKEGGK